MQPFEVTQAGARPFDFDSLDDLGALDDAALSSPLRSIVCPTICQSVPVSLGLPAARSYKPEESALPPRPSSAKGVKRFLVGAEDYLWSTRSIAKNSDTEGRSAGGPDKARERNKKAQRTFRQRQKVTLSTSLELADCKFIVAGC